jgi:hypothetical protein
VTPGATDRKLPRANHSILLPGGFFVTWERRGEKMNPREKLQRRAQLIQESKKLLDKADAEKRNLANEEIRTIDANMGEIERLAA